MSDHFRIGMMVEIYNKWELHSMQEGTDLKARLMNVIEAELIKQGYSPDEFYVTQY
jgi:hypothetical protein